MAFHIHVSADIWGTKENVTLYFTEPPSLGEFFYTIEHTFNAIVVAKRPAGITNAPVHETLFRLAIVHIYDEEAARWCVLSSSPQLISNAQCFVFQPMSEYHIDVPGPIPAPSHTRRVPAVHDYKYIMVSAGRSASRSRSPVRAQEKLQLRLSASSKDARPSRTFVLSPQKNEAVCASRKKGDHDEVRFSPDPALVAAMFDVPPKPRALCPHTGQALNAQSGKRFKSYTIKEESPHRIKRQLSEKSPISSPCRSEQPTVSHNAVVHMSNRLYGLLKIYFTDPKVRHLKLWISDLRRNIPDTSSFPCDFFGDGRSEQSLLTEADMQNLATQFPNIVTALYSEKC